MPDNRSLQELRDKYLSPSFSLSYDRPLHIVSGKGQYLYDSKGKEYLDAVNNTQHVGYCHPKVIEAANEQFKRLNTNTRYLDETIIDYALEVGNELRSLLMELRSDYDIIGDVRGIGLFVGIEGNNNTWLEGYLCL